MMKKNEMTPVFSLTNKKEISTMNAKILTYTIASFAGLFTIGILSMFAVTTQVSKSQGSANISPKMIASTVTVQQHREAIEAISTQYNPVLARSYD